MASRSRRGSTTHNFTAFGKALSQAMQEHADTPASLHRAIVRPGEGFRRESISAWSKGIRGPRHTVNIRMLNRIEAHYGLEIGYLGAVLPRSTIYTQRRVNNQANAFDRRRLAWHLPDDFQLLPATKQTEIIDWINRIILRDATPYNRHHTKAIQARFGLRFDLPSSPADDHAHRRAIRRLYAERPNWRSPTGEAKSASAALTLELASLIRFKTVTLTAIGQHRHGVWSDATVVLRSHHLSLLFGALSEDPVGPHQGAGIPEAHLCFALLAFPAVWDWYLQWRQSRRGFYTVWEDNMLLLAGSFARHKTGWLRQHPELAARLQPAPGLVSQSEIDEAQADWAGACDRFVDYVKTRRRDIRPHTRVHRSKFEAISVVLDDDQPAHTYRKIADEIVRQMPDEATQPLAKAEAVRALLMFRLAMHSGLRQKNLRELLVRKRGEPSTDELTLANLKRGELRWVERRQTWEIFIPHGAFKNADSHFFTAHPYRLILKDMGGLYDLIDGYLARHRTRLLKGSSDPGTFLVKTAGARVRDASYDHASFYQSWLSLIQRYGIYNPYTGRGAIEGLMPHGPHSVRDVLATHILKLTGSAEQAGYAIQDSPITVMKHYGRFMPENKMAIAAKLLDQAWIDQVCITAASPAEGLMRESFSH